MSLAEEIAAKAKEIHSDGYAMSLGEIANLYKDGELRLHPEFQREFRWTETQKSNLIESAMLGIPLPPIFVVQEEDGVWDVIDGLQRLSTFFEFMGILKDKEGQALPGSTLIKTKFLPSLAGKKWEDKTTGDTSSTFTSTQRIDFKRVKIGVTIVTKDSDPEAKYELFQRLNTGGSSLSAQEVRNCLMIMIDESFHHFIRKLSGNLDFKEVLSLSDRQLDEQFDMELICRYFAGKNTPTDQFRNLPDINEFVSEKMIAFAKDPDFDREREEEIFGNLFSLLARLEVHPFTKYNTAKDSFSGMFLISTFEVIAIGLGLYIDKYTISDKDLIISKLKSLWADEDFKNSSGSGKSAKTRMAECVEIGKRIFEK
jgi:hypothetical protein